MKERQGYVYLMEAQATGWYKIGYSTDPARRVEELNRDNPELKWILRYSVFSYDCPYLEKILHQIFARERITQGKEWFRPTRVGLELFSLLVADQELAEKQFRSPSLISRLRDDWIAVLKGVKERGQALTAAVFEEARVEGFDGKVVRLSFPKEKDFHIKMAGDGKHSGILIDALEQRLGVRPRLEFDLR